MTVIRERRVSRAIQKSLLERDREDRDLRGLGGRRKRRGRTLIYNCFFVPSREKSRLHIRKRHAKGGGSCREKGIFVGGVFIGRGTVLIATCTQNGEVILTRE